MLTTDKPGKWEYIKGTMKEVADILTALEAQKYRAIHIHTNEGGFTEALVRRELETAP